MCKQKSSSNVGPKGASSKAKAAAPPAVAPSAAAAAAAPAPPVGYFASLTEEELKVELQKQEERRQKALKEKKKQEKQVQNQQQWEAQQKKNNIKKAREEKKEDKEFQKTLKRALDEGVLEATEYEDDGLWYIEVDQKTWKQVEYPYWCRHCDASLSDSTLQSHLDGQNHKKKLTGATPGQPPPPSQAQQPRTAPAQPSAGPAAAASSQLEPWQELDSSGNIQCVPCCKTCDGYHETVDDHRKRVKEWLFHKELERQGYPAPPQPFLAWVADENMGGGKYLRCLLCEGKEVKDYEGGANEIGQYFGFHGFQSQFNQKDHARKLANYSYYSSRVAADKKRLHPPPATAPAHAASRPAPWATASAQPAGAAAPAPRSQPGPPTDEPPRKPAPPPGSPPSGGASAAFQMPAGSAGGPAAAAPTSSSAFPMRAASAASQPPSSPARSGASDEQLPPGWRSAEDAGTGETYYYKGDHTQWDKPVSEPFPQDDETVEEC